MGMRRLYLVPLGIVLALVAILAAMTVASFAFNLATDGGGKPVRELWSGRFVEADGVLTAFREWGAKGTPIVLIGGFVEPTFVWDEVAPLLAQHHRVYALDLDGFGYSERRGPWTLDEWADQVRGFMRALGLSRPIVVGHSLGAAVAVEVARRGLASRVVLLDGDALDTGGAPWFVRDVLVHTPFATSGIRLAQRWDWPVEKLLANAYGPNHPALDHALVKQWTRPLEAKGAEHALETMAGRKIVGFHADQLGRVPIRATVVWGGEDDVDDREAGRLAARELKAPFVVIPGVGHLSMLEDAPAVARAVLRDP
jgi:pimeloyl-ACP methyl ester carboxylesterase